MTIHVSGVRDVVGWISYGARYLALTLWGPASQDRSVDPLEELKRRYGRPPSR